MDNKICLYLLGILFVLPMVANGSEQSKKELTTVEKFNTILLESADGYRIRVNREIASLSKVIADRLELKTKIIPLPEIDSKSLADLLSIMEFAYMVAKEPFKVRMQKIGDNIDQKLIDKGLKSWEKLLHNINYLDIEILKKPFSDRMIRYIFAQWSGDKNRIENVISYLTISDEWKGLLAKYWYLNYGENKNYILPDLDYGFSVEELVMYNKGPLGLGGLGARTVVDFSDLRIDDLTGLNSIPNIASIEFLSISYNKLRIIPDTIFQEFKQLQCLSLGGNRLEILPPNRFSGLDQLKTLHLYSNMLKWVSEESFNGIDNLEELVLAENKLTKLPETLLIKLKRLKNFNCATNEIALLPEKIFVWSRELNDIDLAVNKLTALPEKLLNGLEQLNTINLSFNDLTTLPNNLFKENPNLRNINLKHNKIVSLSINMFIKSPHLERLDLTENPLNQEIKALLSAQLGDKLKI